MKSGYFRLLLPALFYSLLFGAFSWPLAAHFTTGFLGYASNDANQYVWNAYNFRQALVGGHNPFATTLLLYPRGSSLLMHTYTPIIGLVNLALNQPILAVNLCLLLSFVLSAVGAYRLCGRWVANPVLCLLAGVVYAFSPYKLAHLPYHYHLLLTGAVPFYVWAFLEAFAFEPGRWQLRVRRWRQVAVCAALGLLTLLSDYYTLFGLLYFSLGYALYYWLSLGLIRWHRPRPWLLLAAGLGLCHVASRLLGFSGLPDNSGFWWGGDLAGYLLPPTNSRWLSTAATAQLQHADFFQVPGSVENVMFLGYCLPALLLLTAALRPGKELGAAPASAARGGAPLPWLLLLFFMLTLPAVRVFGKEVLRLPTGLLHYVPFFNNIRCPTRHVAYVALLLPLVLFPRLDAWLLTRTPGLARGVLSGLLLGLVLLEFQPQAAPLMDSAAIPAAYRAVAALPGEAVFPVPFGLLDGYHAKGIMDSNELFYQTMHHKAIPGAYISRIPQATFDQFDQDPVMHALLLRQTYPDSLLPALPTPAQVTTFLRTYRPAAFVVHPEFRNQPVHALLRQLLRGRPYQEQVIDGYVVLKPGTASSPPAGLTGSGASRAGR